MPRVEIRTLTDLSELSDARGVFDEVWPSSDGSSQIQPNLMKAIVHAGGYASAAYLNGAPVAAAFGFLGTHTESEGSAVHLHSHMAAVLAPYRDRSIGSSLKQHQREWALARGIETIVWTFDPLVRRNAVVNLLKLGVDVDGFEPDFYGPMDDAINVGDPTDRLFAWWRLNSDRAAAAAAGALLPLSEAELATRVVRRVDLPEDVVSLRESDSDAAMRWRMSVRTQLQSAMGAGYRIVGVDSASAYVLEAADDD